MSLYERKYEKYKKKYTDLKKILYGGVKELSWRNKPPSIVKPDQPSSRGTGLSWRNKPSSTVKPELQVEPAQPSSRGTGLSSSSQVNQVLQSSRGTGLSWRNKPSSIVKPELQVEPDLQSSRGTELSSSSQVNQVLQSSRGTELMTFRRGITTHLVSTNGIGYNFIGLHGDVIFSTISLSPPKNKKFYNKLLEGLSLLLENMKTSNSWVSLPCYIFNTIKGDGIADVQFTSCGGRIANEEEDLYAMKRELYEEYGGCIIDDTECYNKDNFFLINNKNIDHCENEIPKIGKDSQRRIDSYIYGTPDEMYRFVKKSVESIKKSSNDDNIIGYIIVDIKSLLYIGQKFYEYYGEEFLKYNRLLLTHPQYKSSSEDNSREGLGSGSQISGEIFGNFIITNDGPYAENWKKAQRLK